MTIKLQRQHSSSSSSGDGDSQSCFKIVQVDEDDISNNLRYFCKSSSRVPRKKNSPRKEMATRTNDGPATQTYTYAFKWRRKTTAMTVWNQKEQGTIARGP